MNEIFLLKLGEIVLKGANRKQFENRLKANVARRMHPFGDFKVSILQSTVYVEPQNDQCDVDGAWEACQTIFGVVSLCRCRPCEKDLDAIYAAILAYLGDDLAAASSFKVESKRSDKRFPLNSIQISQHIGGMLAEAFPHVAVDVHNPDVTVIVHVVQGNAYVYADTGPGVGGLPVGTAGKVVSLFSSGFDSPVATWMVGRRGATMIPVHFSGRPMTSDGSEWLCRDLVDALAPSGIIGRMYVVPFGEYQRQISLTVPQSLRVIMYRRVMFAVSERIARLEGAKALVTGESLGQVASQTLDNIAAVNEMVSLPVLRPLIGSDKQEIMRRAEELGTYEISAQDAPDCCTLFMPRKPETHARIREVHEAWDLLDHEAMIEDLVQNVEYIDFDQCASYKPPRGLRARHRELAPRSVGNDYKREETSETA